jgi:predicted dehydrogenase
MARAEAARTDGIEAVAIVTPNHMHFPAAKAFLEAGIHVICDKPLTSNLADAKKLAAIAEKSGRLFVLTHNYTGYPMVRQAREMVQSGVLGNPPGACGICPGLAQRTPGENRAETGRGAPIRSPQGLGGATGDIGTHAYNLGCFVSGLELDSLSADLDAFVDGRKSMTTRMSDALQGRRQGHALGSQVAPGNENAGSSCGSTAKRAGSSGRRKTRTISGTRTLGQPKQLITRNGAGATAAGQRVSRIPGGHPEGYLEGFATIYNEAAEAIIAHRDGKPAPEGVIFPGIEDGLAGVAFVTACVESSRRGGAWLKFESYNKR